MLGIDSLLLVGCSPPSVLTRTYEFYCFGRPTSDWYVEIPTAKYTVFTYQTLNGGTSGTALVKDAQHPRTDITLSIEPANYSSNAVEFRNYRFLQLPVSKPSTEMRMVYEKDSIAYIESDYNDFGIYGHLLSAYYYKDGDVLTISIYTTHYIEAKDRDIYFDLMNSIKFKSRKIR